MKSMKKIFFIAAVSISAFLFSGNVYACDACVKITPLNHSDMDLLQVLVPHKQNGSIYITDSNGHILYSETIKLGPAYSQIYDFTNLEDGIYTFYAEMERTKTTTEMKVENASVEVLNQVHEYLPFFKVEGNQLMVMYLNQEWDEIEFTIKSIDHRIFYNGEEGNPMIFQKIFDISNMLNGEFYAMLKVGNKTSYYYYFEIN